MTAALQVEDVNKKFDALKDAESRGWVEERKPPPRQKKVVKVSQFLSQHFKLPVVVMFCVTQLF